MKGILYAIVWLSNFLIAETMIGDKYWSLAFAMSLVTLIFFADIVETLRSK